MPFITLTAYKGERVRLNTQYIVVYREVTSREMLDRGLFSWLTDSDPSNEDWFFKETPEEIDAMIAAASAPAPQVEQPKPPTVVLRWEKWLDGYKLRGDQGRVVAVVPLGYRWGTYFGNEPDRHKTLYQAVKGAEGVVKAIFNAVGISVTFEGTPTGEGGE